MAALPIIADTFRCAINWAAGSQTFENVIHILAPGKTVAQVATAIDSNTSPNMFIDMCDLCGAGTVSITPLDGTSGTLNEPLTHWVGPLTTADFAPAVASIVTFRTPLRGRSNRGRIYLPAVDTSAIATGLHTTPSNVTAQAAAWAAWSAANTVAGFDHVVASYKHATAIPITVYQGHNAFATQRRRQGRLNP